MSAELVYSPLSPQGTIRVLTVHPGTLNGQVFCSFGFTNLRSPCAYEAISYAWGSSDRTHAVISQTGRTSLPVPASCYAALSAIRDPRHARVIWIDSICINQSDLAEKATQVSMMGKIYAAATCTLVYLGEDDGTYNDLILALRDLRQQTSQASKVKAYSQENVGHDEFNFPDAEHYFDELPRQASTAQRQREITSNELRHYGSGRQYYAANAGPGSRAGWDYDGSGDAYSAGDLSGEDSPFRSEPGPAHDSLIRAMKKLTGHNDTTLDYVVTVTYLANEIEYFSQDYFPPLRAFHKSFFGKIWFTRLWVIQEVALSKNVRVFLGRQSANWGTVMALYNLIDFPSHQFKQSYYGHPLVCDRSILGHHIARKFMSLAEKSTTGYNFGGDQLVLRHRNAFFDDDESHYYQSTLPFPQRLLFDLLYEMRTYGCQDGRDRLFAILSILDGPIPEALRPNYDPAITQGEIFTKIARHQIDCGRFDALACASGIAWIPARFRGMATWATNWIYPPDKRLLINSTTLHANMTVGTKAGMMPMRSIQAGSGDEIVLRGMIFDEVTYVSVSCPPDATRDEFIRVYSCWIWTKKYVHSPELGSRVHYWLTSKKLPKDFFRPYDEYDYLEQDPLGLTPETISESEAQKPRPAFLNRRPAFVRKTGHSKASLEEICRGRAFATVGSPGDQDPEKLEIYEMYLSEPYVPPNTGYSMSDNDDDYDNDADLHTDSGENLAHMMGLPELATRDEPEHSAESHESAEDDASTQRRRQKWWPSKARCLVPHGTKEGDLVCGLLGCELAVVLRPHGKRFRFVGTTTCWEYTIAREAPHLDWDNLLSREPQAPLRDFRIF